MKKLFIVIACIPLTACFGLIKPSVEQEPLVVSSCPETLGELQDNSFGATTLKLEEVSYTYYRCRTAALGTFKTKE